MPYGVKDYNIPYLNDPFRGQRDTRPPQVIRSGGIPPKYTDYEKEMAEKEFQLRAEKHYSDTLDVSIPDNLSGKVYEEAAKRASDYQKNLTSMYGKGLPMDQESYVETVGLRNDLKNFFTEASALNAEKNKDYAIIKADKGKYYDVDYFNEGMKYADETLKRPENGFLRPRAKNSDEMAITTSKDIDKQWSVQTPIGIDPATGYTSFKTEIKIPRDVYGNFLDGRADLDTRERAYSKEWEELDDEEKKKRIEYAGGSKLNAMRDNYNDNAYATLMGMSKEAVRGSRVKDDDANVTEINYVGNEANISPANISIRGYKTKDGEVINQAIVTDITKDGESIRIAYPKKAEAWAQLEKTLGNIDLGGDNAFMEIYQTKKLKDAMSGTEKENWVIEEIPIDQYKDVIEGELKKKKFKITNKSVDKGDDVKPEDKWSKYEIK